MIDLDIQDTTGRVVTISAAQELTLEAVSVLARDKLELPLKDRYGRPLKYDLFHREWGRFLTLDLTVYGHHLHADDRLRILPRPFYHLFELELQSEPNPGMLYPMAGRETSIGRDFSNDIVIRHKSVSRQHGLFEWQNGFHLYIDMDSANGSWINNQPVTELTPIADGDILTLGRKIQLVYRERMTPSDPSTAEVDAVIGEIQTEESRTGLMQIPKAQIYVSFYATEQHLVDGMAEELGKAGIKILTDINDVATAMQISDLMVVILSRESVKSAALLDEWDYYLTLRKPIIPVLFEPCRVPPALAEISPFVEYHHNDTIFARHMMDALHQALSR